MRFASSIAVVVVVVVVVIVVRCKMVAPGSSEESG